MPEPRRIVPDGAFRPGLNLSGSTIPANRIVRDSTAVDQIVLANNATASFKGATQGAIPTGTAGDVQTAGKATVEAGAAVAKSVFVTSDSVGRAILAVTGDFILGKTAVAAAAAGQVLEVELVTQPTVAP